MQREASLPREKHFLSRLVRVSHELSTSVCNRGVGPMIEEEEEEEEEEELYQ